MLEQPRRQPARKPGEIHRPSPPYLYQGFSIHGNEPSGGNAAPLVAYYLAAAPYEAVALKCWITTSYYSTPATTPTASTASPAG